MNTLVVDDEESVGQAHAEMLRSLGHVAQVETDPTRVIERLEKEFIDLILLDLRMPQMDGLEVLRRVKLSAPQVGIVIATVVNDIEHAVRAIKSGAYNYLLKPLSPDRLGAVLDSIAKNQPRSLMSDSRFSNIVTQSPLFEEIFRRVQAFSTADVMLLIEGETGTGKDLLAQLVHALSPRKSEPFVAVNSGALPDSIFESEMFGHCKGAFTGAVKDKIGYIEAAGKGTLFIDEIGELGPEQQKKLLRVLQSKNFARVGETKERPVDARLIFATNRDLPALVNKGQFRSDLYYRLSGHSIKVPPLRDRGGDTRLLANYFFRKYCSQHGRLLEGIDESALETLSRYPFPGNVRELEGVISASVLLEQSLTIKSETLPPYISNYNTQKETPSDDLEGIRYQAILNALSESDGNQTKAAKRLGIARETLNRILRRYRGEGLTPPTA